MVGAQGQAKWAKAAWKSSTYDVTHKKPAYLKQKNFFRVQTRRLAVSFETFAGSVEQTGMEKFPRKAMCVKAFFFLKIPETSRTTKSQFVYLRS